jgi:hypothetical protein
MAASHLCTVLARMSAFIYLICMHERIYLFNLHE